MLRPLLRWRTALLFPLVMGPQCTTIHKVSVDSEPPGARIFIDGDDSGEVTPAKVYLSSSEESYEIEVVKHGFNPARFVVKKRTDVQVIRPEEVAGSVLCAPCCLGLPLVRLLQPVTVTKLFWPEDLKIQLDQEGQGAKLMRLEPPDTELYVDGFLQHLLAGRYLTMEPGEHDLRATASGFRDQILRLRVKEGTYQELGIELAVEGQGLVLTVTPLSATILLDGQPHGRGGLEPRRILLDHGAHELVVEAEGYQTFRQRVQVVMNHFEDMDLVLTPKGEGVFLYKPERLPFQVKNLQILIDGKVHGTVFGVPIRLKPRSYDIEVRLPGYKTWIRSVVIQEGQFLEMEPTLRAVQRP